MSEMDWTVETVSAVDAEIAALPVALRARLLRLLETVENVGLGLYARRMSGMLRGSCGSFGCGQSAASLGEYR